MKGIFEMQTTFRTDGYLIRENFFDASIMDAMHSVLEKYFNNFTPQQAENFKEAQCSANYWVPTNGPEKEALERIDDTRFKRTTQEVIGEYRSWYTLCMLSKQDSMGLPWHRDYAIAPPKGFSFNRLIYTHDVTHQSGGELLIVPGSHLETRKIPHGEPHAPLPGERILRPKKGTLIFLHGQTFHRVLKPKGSDRYSINFRGGSIGVPEDLCDLVEYRNMTYRFSNRHSTKREE